MDFINKVLDYAERLPEGIERTRDQIIGTLKSLLRPNPMIIITLVIINPNRHHDKLEEKLDNEIQAQINSCYIQLINKANHFIYIKNQFFISHTCKEGPVKNQIAKALVKWIIKAAKDDRKFKLDSQRLRIDPVRWAIQYGPTVWNSAHASGWAKCRCHSMNGTIVMGHKYRKRAQVSRPVIPGPITILGRVRISSVHKHPEGPNWSSYSICGSVRLVRFRPSAPISGRPKLAQHMRIHADQGGPQYAGKSGGPTMKEFLVVMGVTDGPSKFFRPTRYAYDPAQRGNV
ncbi:hypothetical protein BDR06DRAFT_1055421 [Suillus hirtellus]|nr:hypothetical protein BDR06DRAFT_1055421 [Suillus hirtellus]